MSDFNIEFGFLIEIVLKAEFFFLVPASQMKPLCGLVPDSSVVPDTTLFFLTAITFLRLL